MCESSLRPRPHVFLESGRKLQIIKSRHRADHMPVAVSFCTGVYVSQGTSPCMIDRDALMCCSLFGKGRHKFVRELQQAMQAPEPQWDIASHWNSPTQMYAVLVGALNYTMYTCFGKSQADNTE